MSAQTSLRFSDGVELSLGDGIAHMPAMEAGSVDLILSDLPSGETRADFDKPIDLSDFWPEAWRVLKPNGVVALMASSMRFAASVVASQSKWFRYDIVWEKTRATGFLNAKRQPMRAHEFLLVFYRRQPTYNPQKTTGHKPMHKAEGPHDGVNYGARGDCPARGGATDRYPRSVQRFAPVPNVGGARRHPQQKPEEWLRWVIRTFTDPGGLVLDICAGSGSAGMAAVAEGRRFEGWEIREEFVQSFAEVIR